MSAEQMRGLIAAASLLIPTTVLANLPARAVALSGQPAPGHGTFAPFESDNGIALNNKGQLMFFGDDQQDHNVWLRSTTGALLPLYHTLDQAPGFPPGNLLSMASTSSINWYLNEAGQTILTESCCSAWLAGPGSLQLVGSGSNPPAGVTGTVAGVRIDHLNDGGNIALFYHTASTEGVGTLLAGPPASLQVVAQGSDIGEAMLDNAGNVAFLARQGGTYGIWRGQPGNLHLIATGDSSHRIESPYLSNDGHIAFTGSTPSGTSALLVGAPGSAPTVVLRNGDPAPGLPGKTIETPLYPRINDAGQVVFIDSVDGRNGLWTGVPGSIRPVVLEGDSLPGDVAGLVATDLWGLPMLNGNGQVLFRAFYRNSITSQTGIGLWATDRDGGLHLVVRNHALLEFDGQARTVSGLGLRFDLNDSQQVAFVAQFTDGTSGVFLATVPEPSAFLLLMPILPLIRRGRRRSMST